MVAQEHLPVESGCPDMYGGFWSVCSDLYPSDPSSTKRQPRPRSGTSLSRTPSSPRTREDVSGSEQTTHHEFIPFRTPCYASAPSVPLCSGLVLAVMGFSSCPQVIAQGGNRELLISWVCAGSSRSKYGYLSFHIGVWMGAKIVPSTSLQSCTQSLIWLSSFLEHLPCHQH